MAAGRLSGQDRKDLERFTKFLIYKSLQIIVQSRLGDKIKTLSKSESSGLDWFNIAIKDIPSVQSEVKRLLSGSQISVGLNVCVEITLKTCGGESMTLEIWHMSISDIYDSSVKTAHTAYYKMAIGLKSLTTVSRITPAYKLARQQKGANYLICYQIYHGEPKHYLLGDGYKMAHVSSVPLVTGRVAIRVAYRTKLSECANRFSGFDVHPDHFLNDRLSPKRHFARPCNAEYYREVTGLMESDAFSPPTPVSSSPADISPGVRHSMDEIDGITDADGTDFVERTIDSFQAVPPITITNESTHDTYISHSCVTDDPSSPPKPTRKVSAFSQQHTLRDFKTELDDVPFESLLRSNGIVVVTDTEQSPSDRRETDASPIAAENRSGDVDGSSSRTTEASPASEDFILLDLKTPFAGHDLESELNQFYRDCQAAPPLTMFDYEPDMDHTLSSISDQLRLFETTMQDFDHFMFNLQDCD